MYNHTKILTFSCVCLSFAAWAIQSGRAATYTFTEIARANTGLGAGIDFSDILAYGIDPGVSINSAGVVAFRAAENSVVSGVYYGAGGSITQVADDDVGSPYVGFHGTPSINASNQVAFKASVDPMTTGIFRGDGGPVTTIVTTGPGSFGGLGEKPAINSSGNVAFLTSPTGVYVGTGGPLVPLYAYGDLKGVEPVSDPAFNDLGQVAFQGTALGVHGIHRGSGGPVTTVMDLDSGFFTGAGDASMNGLSSSVAWRSYTATGEGIFRSTGGAPMTVADNLGPYSGFALSGDPSVSVAAVAFHATLDDGGHGLFTGPDPVADKVIQTGDPLLGSTVVSLQPLARTSMNDLGQIGFVANLASGDVVVARANPFAGPSPIGDYDGSGIVDASDYVVWRHLLGATGRVLLADGDASGTVDSGDYEIWRSHFGTAVSIRSTLALSSTTAVPEPPSGLLWIVAAAIGRWQRRRMASANTVE
jgi:hypothetical protein